MNTICNKQVQVQDLGLIDYQLSWDYQERLLAEIVAAKIANRNLPVDAQTLTPNYVLFCQHPHVYTLGKSGKEDHLLANDAFLQTLGATYYKINRGGDITYHGPGQLVGYPILDLDNFFTDIHRYMRLLEETIIRTLADYGLDAGRIDGLTGVWLDYRTDKKQSNGPRKICAMGVKASRWVTMHGFALNVNTDLSYFNHIVPCGISDKAVTSMQAELGRDVSVTEVAERVAHHLADLFEMELTSVPAGVSRLLV
ncbi:lipoyl(octanoyl) transferase [Larkinella arboricola]|uniref:Octanoyltransferase n=1 Tax=Larkinella arboricola TaxID=643671 RepID=A0A327WYC6_LARAB|nr:lipoyl(octanoyl) transferase LipB [Larkinella arboricola]RAJ98153.1 lipoyl(octanoyl) transferase [Larkinella arboricola]